MVPFKEMIKIPLVKHSVMKFLGLKTKEKDDGNPHGLNIGVSGFLSKLSMPVQFFEIVKLPSMHKRATSYLGVTPKKISMKPQCRFIQNL